MKLGGGILYDKRVLEDNIIVNSFSKIYKNYQLY